MFDHVEFSVDSYENSFKFYSSFLSILGYKIQFNDCERKEAGFGVNQSTELLLFERGLLKPSIHIAFKVNSIEQVKEFYKQAISNGGTCNGAPGYRKSYAPGYYAAFVFDPDGHNVEALFRDPTKK